MRHKCVRISIVITRPDDKRKAPSRELSVRLCCMQKIVEVHPLDQYNLIET